MVTISIPEQIMTDILIDGFLRPLGEGLAQGLAGMVAGGVIVVGAVATFGLHKLAQALSKNYNWKVSTYNFLRASSTAVVVVAMTVSFVALGLLTPLGVAVFAGFSLLGLALPLGLAIAAKCGKMEDLPFKEAQQRVNWKQSYNFYNFATL